MTTPFVMFDDQELEMLAVAMDALSGDVARGNPAAVSLVHAYNCERGRRANERTLNERRYRRGEPLQPTKRQKMGLEPETRTEGPKV